MAKDSKFMDIETSQNTGLLHEIYVCLMGNIVNSAGNILDYHWIVA
jgi:hypothetical protein